MKIKNKKNLDKNTHFTNLELNILIFQLKIFANVENIPFIFFKIEKPIANV